MKDTVNKYIEKFKKKHRNYRHYSILFLVLAVMTIMGVNWELHRDGISMTADAEQAEVQSEISETEADAFQTELSETIAYESQIDTPETMEDENLSDVSVADNEDIQTAEDEDTAVVRSTDDPVEMNSCVTGLSGSGTKYDENGNMYSTDLRIDFKFEKETVKNKGLNYYYEYPEGIIVPDGLLDQKKDLYDSEGKKAGVYYFEKTADGKYRVKIDFDQSYVDASTTGNDITGYIQFSGQVDAGKADDDGNIKIVGEDNVTLDIPKTEITYPDGVTNKYEIRTKKYGSYQQKDGKLVYTVYVYSLKGTPDDIEFKDTIQANGLTLGDPNVKVTKETVKRYEWGDSNETPLSEELSVNHTYVDGELSMTLPKIDAAEHVDETTSEKAYDRYTRYKIEYTYDISEIPEGAASVNNTVSTVSTNNKTTVKAEDSKEVDIKTVVDSIIEKSGVGGGGVDYITWTITVNPGKDNIAGATLRDDMLAKLISGHFSVRPDEGYELVKDNDGNIIGIDFKEVANGENRNSYTITYRTPAQTEWNGTETTNKATFTPAGGGDGESAEATVEIDGTRVEKTMDGAEDIVSGESVAVKWTVKINAPTDAMPAGTVIKGDPTKDSYGAAGCRQYLTRQQVIDWAKNIYWANSSGEKIGNPDLTNSEVATVKFLASDGKEYTWQEINSGSIDDSLTYTVCTITLKEELTTPKNAAFLMFKYTTTADVSNAVAGSNDYKNTVSVDNKKDDAIYTYKKGNVTKTDENNVTDTTQKVNDDGTLTWKIKVDTAKDTGKLTITDDLPENVTLEGLTGENQLSNLSVDISGEDVSGTAGSGYTVRGSYKNNKLELNITADNNNNLLKSGQYTLVVTCKVDKDTINDYEAGKTYTFTNNASARDDNGEIGSADQTQEWTEDSEHSNAKIVDKTVQWDNDSRRFKYSIKLNPYGKDIVEGSDFLTLEDEFQYNDLIYGYPSGDGWSDKYILYKTTAWLIPDSVKLYKGVPDGNGGLTKGEEITDWTWTVKTSQDPYTNSEGITKQYSTITGSNLPDSTPLILEYDYQMQSEMPENYYANITVENNAKLYGTDYGDNNNSGQVKWDKQDSSGQVTTDIRGVLYKVSKGNYGKRLPGAEFKLQKYDVEQNTYVDENVTYITDADGKIVIQWQKSDSDVQYDHNVLYRVVETNAPEGYDTPSTPEAEAKAFYFYFKDETDTSHTLPENLSELAPNAADLLSTSTVFYVENESSSTEITVNKEWLDKDGNEDVGHSGSIKVNLYQIASMKQSSGDSGNTATLKGDIRQGDITWQNVWKTFEEKEYPAGTKISFTITLKNEWMNNTPDKYIPDMYVNDTAITPVIGTVDGKTTYTYTFTLSDGENTILGAVKESWTPDSDYELSEVTAEEPSTGGDSGDTTDKTEKLYGTYDITSEENWSKTISGLPTKGKNDAGETVYYTYRVEEVGNNNYDVTYDNNGGIAEGIITVKNQTSDSPSYELPSTGGAGTNRLTTVGALLMGAALLCGCTLKRKQKRTSDK